MNTNNRTDALLRFSERIVDIEDIDALLDQLLYEARSQCNADAGSIYLLENNQLRFSYVQNDTIDHQRDDSRQYIYSDQLLPIDAKSVAGFTASTRETVNIKNVYQLPTDATYQFNDSFDKKSGYQTQSILSAPLTKQSGELIGVLQLINKKESSGFIDEDLDYLNHVSTIASGAIKRAQTSNSILMRMLRMAELRDPAETGAHVNRVGAYSVEIYNSWAQQHGIPEKEIRAYRGTLRIAAMLHDVGKIAISDLLLKKPGKLTKDEFEIIKTHTSIGAELFENSTIKLDQLSHDIILNHHERWDGNGYPNNIAGEKIPLAARIVTLADVYDALISNRSYKKAWREKESIQYLSEQAGHQFDPEIVDIFLSIQDIIQEIRNRYRE